MVADIGSFVKWLSLEEKAALVVGAGRPRRILGVAGETRPIRAPPVALADGPSGLRIEPSGERKWYATAFPAPVVLAATWDVELVERARASSRDIGLRGEFLLSQELRFGK